jgi:hypothetical protein
VRRGKRNNAAQGQERSPAQASPERAIPPHPDRVEIWFSILEEKSLHGASCTSQAAQERIDAFIESYNQHAKPFVWIKVEVHRSTYQPTVSPGIIFSKRPAMKSIAP